jgi:hypothetical protein
VLKSNIVNVDEIAGLADVFDICGGGEKQGPAHCAKLAVVAPSIVAATTAMRRTASVIRLTDPAYVAAVVTLEAPSLNTVKAPSSPTVETASEAGRPSSTITAPDGGFLRCSKPVSKPRRMRARSTFGLAVVNAQHAVVRLLSHASAVFLVFVA